MVRSNQALVNDVFNEVAHLLSDMGALRGAPNGSEERLGFSGFSKLFCDSIIFWGLYNSAREDTKGTTIGKYIMDLRHAFKKSSLEVDSVKLTHCGHVDINDEYFSKRIKRSHRKEFDGEPYKAGYIAIKVSLNYCRAKRVVPVLANLLPILEDSTIVLHDIDFAYDCKRITTRSLLTRYIYHNQGGKVVDDRRRVGNHCISWKGTKKGTKNIRYKVYNKFVQILESAEVRKSLGSRMEDLVEKEGKFARQLKRKKMDGYTRIELTFYGASLRSLWEYQERMMEAREFLKGCKTYKCSFEDQWRERASCIKSMVAVYFPKKKLFAYCHWWNSLTSKKYGYMWSGNVFSKAVPQLLANYSFNDRPIHYFEADVGENGKAIITEEKTFRRMPGCTARTMVPGPQKGRYPSREECPNGALKFRSIGIIKVDNIRIAWPKKAHDRRSPPLAEIVEWKEESNEMVAHLKVTHTSLYTAASEILETNGEYTIVAAGYVEYREIHRWHFITECGLKIRDVPSLRRIWTRWRMRHLGVDCRYRDVDKTPWMTFCVVRHFRVNGYDDVECQIV